LAVFSFSLLASDNICTYIHVIIYSIYTRYNIQYMMKLATLLYER
jgi:hypothetical protein